MSLVAYGSSDESDNEEETSEQPQVERKTQSAAIQNVNKTSKLQLPVPKLEEPHELEGESTNNHKEQTLNFDVIPKPKLIEENIEINLQEIDNAPMPKKIDYGLIEKPPKKKKGPIKISIPSLSDFKDVDEECEQNHMKKQTSQKTSGLINLLPPPKSSLVTMKTNVMVPHALTKKPIEIKKPIQTNVPSIQPKKMNNKSIAQKKAESSKLMSVFNYTSDSEDEDNEVSSSGIDFFSLSAPTSIPDEILPTSVRNEIDAITALPSSNESNRVEENSLNEANKTNKGLTSNIMNLPKEEILLKNKAEVGPKLPIPEQEYNVDSEGNVAFDEKAIEYLCGKRGVKRKNEFDNVDIIEISGEDIKPDEREWMIKALTDEAAQRPVSVGAGPSGQSKKKHQITYLAHQAKAMELELKNQWAQNKASRQQTRSKYGF
ncbi:PREDICTED: proline-rich protein PRCC [Ceratosolen solmsi marchali]|uniref:Proline-rich protein PRCC n=1 Tax=Ceratosolen solmsi marchali TaxID=326594 RepID=A0AAJ6YLL5_9HYME|nr:PREDICTED: proline-rich protein PRCC [Ceratosolen solmsi marchali]